MRGRRWEIPISGPTNGKVQRAGFLFPGMEMNRRELVRALVAQTKLPVATAARVIDEIFGLPGGIIPEALRRGERVQVPGFGTFEPRRREARKGRNPRTGREIDVAASTSAAFRPGRALKDSLVGAPRVGPVTRGPGSATSSTGPRRGGGG